MRRTTTTTEDAQNRRAVEARQPQARAERAERIETALRQLLSHFAPQCGEYLDGNDEHAETYNACQQAREALES